MRTARQALRPRNGDRGPQTSPNNDDRNLNYRSFPSESSGAEAIPSHPNYRGFNTSINGMFTNPEYERVDCCALACCGILQSDRDRFLLMGTKPPSGFRRFWLHIILPVCLFVSACLCAVNVQDPFLNSMLSIGFLFTLIGYFAIQCFKGSWKRRQVRKELLWTKYQLLTSGDIHQHRTEADSIQEENSEDVPAYYMGQTKSDLKNAHSCCSCYVRDRPLHDEDAEGRDPEEDQTSICTRFFECYTNSCCGTLCGMHMQLCGLCALAQEARQVESLLHAGYRRVDYITMQPMLEYYPAIYQARNTEDALTTWWWGRLSRFSKWVVGDCAVFLVLLFIWSLIASNFNHAFRPANFIVFCCTLLQAFVLLSIIYWRHTSDVSVDALIKLFASGFCLSTTLAVTFEMCLGLSLRATMSILMAMSGIDVVTGDGYNDVLALSMPGFGNFWMSAQESGAGTATYRDFLQAYGNDHPFVYTVYLFVNAFFLAAMIEELSKYFGYRMVDHPDFLAKRALDEASEIYNQDEEEEGQRPDDALDFSQQDRSLKSRGAAVTVSMVAASLGFACCENLIYIFVYGEATLTMEVLILIARSLFPVHPIAAALQSIRVCERDLEKNSKIRLGDIILPAVLFHGFYDFFLMWIDFMDTRHGQFLEAADDDAVEASGAGDLYSVVVSLLLIAVTLIYYFRESRKQRARFEAIDNQTTVDQSSLI
jgi:RsiW-degrading membrane proteinase PrsW (M82 family)